MPTAQCRNGGTLHACDRANLTHDDTSSNKQILSILCRSLSLVLSRYQCYHSCAPVAQAGGGVPAAGMRWRGEINGEQRGSWCQVRDRSRFYADDETLGRPPPVGASLPSVLDTAPRESRHKCLEDTGHRKMQRREKRGELGSTSMTCQGGRVGGGEDVGDADDAFVVLHGTC